MFEQKGNNEGKDDSVDRGDDLFAMGTGMGFKGGQILHISSGTRVLVARLSSCP